MITHYTVGIAVVVVTAIMVAIILLAARSPHGYGHQEHKDHH